MGDIRVNALTIFIRRMTDSGLVSAGSDAKAFANTLAPSETKNEKNIQTANANRAKAAGPHTVEAYRGDVAMIMATVFEVMYDLDPALTADLRARPLDVAGVATYGESRVGFTGSMDVAGLRATVETVKHMITKMEAKQDEEP